MLVVGIKWELLFEQGIHEVRIVKFNQHEFWRDLNDLSEFASDNMIRTLIKAHNENIAHISKIGFVLVRMFCKCIILFLIKHYDFDDWG